MSNINFTCDVCGREVQGCTWVNGMTFCAKCYQETFGNKNMTENLNNMYDAYLKILNEKDQRIAELEEQLKNAIVPKFKRQEIVYSIEYGEINEIEELQVVAYLDNYIILCVNRETGKLDWVHKDYLFATKEEAEQKLKEIKDGN